MSQVKKFMIGDLVFAQIRGYPAWPAKIQNIKNKKYYVYFYGTGEHGYVFPKDIYAYFENKTKFVNNTSLKRQDFHAALDEIEDVILQSNSASCDVTAIQSEDVTSNEGTIAVATQVSGDGPTTQLINGEFKTPITILKRKYKKMNPSLASLDRKKKIAGRLLEIEETMLEMNAKIRSSLLKTSANPDMGLDFLRELKTLKVTPLMLKKNTDCVESIRLLRRYVGNTKDWNFSEDEILHFNELSENIRNISVEIYNHYKNLFAAPVNVEFKDFFDNQVRIFRLRTQHLRDFEIAGLYEEPDSVQGEGEEAWPLVTGDL